MWQTFYIIWIQWYIKYEHRKPISLFRYLLPNGNALQARIKIFFGGEEDDVSSIPVLFRYSIFIFLEKSILWARQDQYTVFRIVMYEVILLSSDALYCISMSPSKCTWFFLCYKCLYTRVAVKIKWTVYISSSCRHNKCLQILNARKGFEQDELVLKKILYYNGCQEAWKTQFNFK